MKEVLLIILILTFYSCSNSIQKENNETIFFPDAIPNNKVENEVVLELKSSFMECGEWGGHEENIYIKVNRNKEFNLKYELWCANCDSIVEFTDDNGTYGTAQRYLVDSTIIKLSNEAKVAIIDFTQDLIRAKYREKISGNAGIMFNLRKLDWGGESLMINVYGYDPEIVSDYLSLLNSLNLKTNKQYSCIDYYGIH